MTSGGFATTRFDLFRIDAVVGLQQAAHLVASRTGFVAERHESEFFGGDYYVMRGPLPVEAKIHVNGRDDEGYLLEDELPEGTILVYVSGRELDVQAFVARLHDLVVVKSERYDGRRQARR